MLTNENALPQLCISLCSEAFSVQNKEHLKIFSSDVSKLWYIQNKIALVLIYVRNVPNRNLPRMSVGLLSFSRLTVAACTVASPGGGWLDFSPEASEVTAATAVSGDILTSGVVASSEWPFCWLKGEAVSFYAWLLYIIHCTSLINWPWPQVTNIWRKIFCQNLVQSTVCWLVLHGYNFSKSDCATKWQDLNFHIKSNRKY